MCGIVGATSQNNIVPFLLEGLKRLEYRGYDSVGIAVLDESDGFKLLQMAGQVATLEKKLKEHTIQGITGLDHTRWATHGKPSEENAHPIRISIGIAVYPTHGETPKTLMEAADSALYEAKQTGRDKVCLYINQISLSIEISTRKNDGY